MKTLFALLALLLLGSVAHADPFEGRFARRHDVQVHLDSGKRGCRELGGIAWEPNSKGSRSGRCTYDGTDADMIELKSNGGGYDFTLVSVGGAAHECDIGGTAKMVAANKLVAEIPTDSGKVCSITITRKGNVVTTEGDPDCNIHEYGCPSATGPDLDGLVRK